ncbi:MAG: V-type ATP synthase subunit E [Infirmifilum sp.]|nr:V-type ATP synthase subunit E family protein [Infirmifilum uzonense]
MSENQNFMEAIIKELRSAAEEEYQRIIREAEEEAKRILDEANVKAEDLRKQKINQLLTETRQKIEAELAPRRLEIRRKYLAERYNYIFNLLEEVLSQVALEVLRDENHYYAFLSKRFEEAIQNMKNNQITIRPCRGSKTIIEKVIRDKTSALTKVKPGLVLSVGEEIDCQGGFVAESADAKEYFNATLEARLTEIRERVLPELLKKLLYENKEK